MKCLDWNDKGLKINGRQINHLDFADDIGLVAKSYEEAAQMLADIKLECEKVGLRINIDKTVIMSNIAGPHNINIEGRYIKTTTYGQNISFTHNCTTKEVQRRIHLSWGAFGNLNDILKAD